MNIKLYNLIYIISWVLAWLMLTFIINKGLLQVSLYSKGSDLEIVIYILSAILFVFGAVSFYNEIFAELRQR